MTGLEALAPDYAIASFTVGILLVFVELNRPGKVLPGAVGLLLILLSVAKLWPMVRHPLGPVCLMAGALLLLLPLRRDVSWALSLVGTALWIAGVSLSVELSGFAHLWITVVCGTCVGVSASGLARIAHRARVNKGLD